MDSELTTVAAVKQALGVTNTGDDPLLARLVAGASAAVQTYCGRAFVLQSLTETYNGNGKAVMALRQTPIVSVSSVTVDGVTIPPRPAPTQAGFSFDEMLVYLEGGAFSTAYNVPGWSGYVFSVGRQNIVVSYQAGFAAIPWDLEEAVMWIVGYRYKRRHHLDTSAMALPAGGGTTSYLRDLPADVKATLDLYARPPIPVW